MDFQELKQIGELKYNFDKMIDQIKNVKEADFQQLSEHIGKTINDSGKIY